MGDIIGLNYSSVIATLKLYISDEDEQKRIFEDIIMIWDIEQELK